jgi:hypothetical protein
MTTRLTSDAQYAMLGDTNSDRNITMSREAGRSVRAHPYGSYHA